MHEKALLANERVYNDEANTGAETFKKRLFPGDDYYAVRWQFPGAGGALSAAVGD
jgi:hypothetical protein